MHVFQLDRDIPASVSLAQQTNPSNPEGTVSVGGGKYVSGYDLAGLSILVKIVKGFHWIRESTPLSTALSTKCPIRLTGASP